MDADIESRREFQKLVFISTRTFGEKQAKFLLPWNRIFRVSDAQVDLALKTSASNLFKTHLENTGAITTLDAALLTAAKAYQAEIHLADKDAAELVTGLVQATVVAKVEAAAELASARTVNSDYTAANAILREVLTFNGVAAAAGGAVPGLAATTLAGTPFDDRRAECEQLFKNFISSGTEQGEFTAALKEECAALKVLFGMGNKEAATVVLEITTKVYREQLRDAVKSGALDSAESPAKVLQSICEKLQFPPDVAAEVNKENYRSKMEALMEKKMLTDEDVEALARVRKLLCVPKEVVDQCTLDICGSVYAAAVRSALSVGTESFTPELRDRCKAAKAAVRLTDDMALKILTVEVKKAFMVYIKDARVKQNKIEQSKEIRKMIFFNAACVTPMVRDVTKAAAEAAAKELAELPKEAQAAADKEEAEEKAAAAAAAAEAKAAAKAAAKEAGEEAGEEGEDAKEGEDAEEKEGEAAVAEAKVEAKKEPEIKVEEPTYQKEVNVSEEMEVAARSALYQDYLMFCMQGDTVTAPMGRVACSFERRPLASPARVNQ